MFAHKMATIRVPLAEFREWLQLAPNIEIAAIRYDPFFSVGNVEMLLVGDGLPERTILPQYAEGPYIHVADHISVSKRKEIQR